MKINFQFWPQIGAKFLVLQSFHWGRECCLLYLKCCLMSCDVECSVSHLRGAMCWYAVYDCRFPGHTHLLFSYFPGQVIFCILPVIPKAKAYF